MNWRPHSVPMLLSRSINRLERGDADQQQNSCPHSGLDQSICRSTLLAALQRKLFVPYCIMDFAQIETMASLFAVDTCYGRLPEPVVNRTPAV